MHPYTFDNANTVGQNVGHLDKGGEWKGISFQQVRLLAAGDVGSIKPLMSTVSTLHYVRQVEKQP